MGGIMLGISSTVVLGDVWVKGVGKLAAIIHGHVQVPPAYVRSASENRNRSMEWFVWKNETDRRAVNCPKRYSRWLR